MIHTIKVKDIHINLEEPRHAKDITDAVSILVTNENDTIVLDFSDTGSLTPTFATCICIHMRRMSFLADVKFTLTGLKQYQSNTIIASLAVVDKKQEVI